MGRKSTVAKLPAAARKYLEKQLRDDRMTLDQLYADMRQRFPDLAEKGEIPSRSAVGRYQIGFKEMVGRMRDIETASDALVAELGEGVGDKAGALLAQAVTTLATNAALRAHNTEDISIKEVTDLARAARAAMQARTMSIKERQVVAEEAKRQLLEEQARNLEKMGKAGGVTVETRDAIRQLLGIST